MRKKASIKPTLVVSYDMYAAVLIRCLHILPKRELSYWRTKINNLMINNATHNYSDVTTNQGKFKINYGYKVRTTRPSATTSFLLLVPKKTIIVRNRLYDD
jgi:hypothetical protein